jgi:hypothetical protein
MTPSEQRYRRTLRLLPVGYRQLWEEDMVSAYMESASHHGGDAPSTGAWAEHRSVFGLAARLRLSAAHASPRGLAGRGAVHGFALVGLLYLAVSGIVSGTGFVAEGGQAAILHRLTAMSALLWVAAFITLVLGRATATRVLAFVAFLAQVGLAIADLVTEVRPFVQSLPSDPHTSLGWRQSVELTVANGVWLGLITIATLIAADARPAKAGRERWLWLGGAAVLALALAAAEVHASAGFPVQPWPHVSLMVAVHLGLLAAMVAALTLHRDPRWLLALALFVMVFAGGELLDYLRYVLDGKSIGQDYFSPLSYAQRFDIGLLALAVGCAVVGLIGLRRLDARRPAAADA